MIAAKSVSRKLGRFYIFQYCSQFKDLISCLEKLIEDRREHSQSLPAASHLQGSLASSKTAGKDTQLIRPVRLLANESAPNGSSNPAELVQAVALMDITDLKRIDVAQERTPVTVIWS